MSANVFCSCSLDVFSPIPVRETVRESSESGDPPDVRFPPAPLISTLFGQGRVLSANKTARPSLQAFVPSSTVRARSTPSAYSLERASGLSERVCYILVMTKPATKDRILKAVEDLPDDATLEEAIEKLCFLAKVERGVKQANEGNTVPHDEVKDRLLG